VNKISISNGVKRGYFTTLYRVAIYGHFKQAQLYVVNYVLRLHGGDKGKFRKDSLKRI
jgi:hypothetical protein